MKMKAVSSPQVREPKPQTWSNCKVYGNHVYISGMTAHDLAGKLFVRTGLGPLTVKPLAIERLGVPLAASEVWHPAELVPAVQ